MNARRDVLFVLSGLTVALILAVTIRAQEEEEVVDPRILAYDKGPMTIDVSNYPADMQARYEVFSAKCGVKCHKLSRPINCELVLASEWETYLKRMMRKAGSYLSVEEVTQVYEFLVYDAQVRKKALYDQKLQEAQAGG